MTAPERAGDVTRPEGSVAISLAITVSCAFFMENFDGTVLATALPSLARSLGTNPVSASIGITAYLISLAMFISLSGWLADRFGSRTVFLGAIVIFAAASLACAGANSLGVFALARGVQGVGGAMMVPVGRLIVLKTTARAQLVRAMSIVTTPALLGAALGPPIGGFLSTYLSWRAIFLVNLPIALVGIVLVCLHIPNLREPAQRFDWIGFLLGSLAIGASMLGLQSLTHGGSPSPAAVVIIAAGAALLLATVVHARFKPHGLLDLSLLKAPTFASAIAGGALFFTSAASVPFLLPLLLQIGFGMSPLTSGVVVLASALGGLFIKRLAPVLLRRFGFRRLLIANGLGVAFAMLLCAISGGRTPIFLTAAILFGFGLLRSLQFSALNTLAYADVPSANSSRATSLADTLKQLWQGVGVTVAAILLQILDRWLPTRSAAPPIELAMAAMALLGAGSVFVFAKLAPDAGASVSGFVAHPAAGAET